MRVRFDEKRRTRRETEASPVELTEPGMAGVLDLQRGAGNAAVSRLLSQRATSRTLARQWMFLPEILRNDRARDRYYWDPSGGPEPAFPPGIVRRFNLTKVDDPSTLSPRDVRFTEAQYLTYAGNTGKAKTVYNPFGRFSEDVSATAFMPAPGVAFPQELGAQGEHEEINYDVAPTEYIAEGIPAAVVTKTGKRLNAMSVVSPFGVMYGDGPGLAPSAQPERARKTQLRGGVPPAIKVALDLLGRSVEAQHIDAGVIAGYRGSRKEDLGQIEVMGVSAAKVAAAAGYDQAIDPQFAADTSAAGQKKHGWEWLHLVAYELGGPSATGPQSAPNLVVGTKAANTSMIMVEDAIVDAISSKYAKSADVQVLAVLADEEYRVAESIHYVVEFELPDGRRIAMPTIVFSALAVSTPFVAANRYFRELLRQHLATAAAEPQPMKTEHVYM
jgi:hypothetical protein